MKKLVFNTFNFAPSFLAPSLNMVQESVDAGDEVYFLTCSKSFTTCGFNSFGLRYMCGICEYRLHHAKDQINGKYHHLTMKDIFQPVDVQQADEFMKGVTTVSKDTWYEIFDLGESVLSSYISKTRDRDLELTANKEVLVGLTRHTLIAYLAIKRFLEENKIDQVVIFNGRWDYYRAAFRAALALQIPVLIHENLREGGFIELFENSFPHIIKSKQRNYDLFWQQNLDTEAKKEIARNFFERKRNGEAIVDRSYTKSQVRSYLPPEIDLEKKMIVLFTSSDDETAAIGGGEYTNPLFADQNEGIQYVADYIGNHLTEFILVIRMHPNLSGLIFDYLNPVYALKGKYPNVLLITPESKVDSYALIDHAFKVISFGSSVGMEANYWRKPVILLAKAFYFYADLAYLPNEKEDIPSLLVNDLPPKPIENSEKIAYYLLKGGVKAKYYNFAFGKNFFFKNINLTKLPFLIRNYFRILKLLKLHN